MLLQKPLQGFVAWDIILLQAKYLEGLLLRHETALDTEALFGNLLAALVCELLGLVLVVLLVDEPQDALVAFSDRQRPDHPLKGGRLTLLIGLRLFRALSEIEPGCLELS